MTPTVYRMLIELIIIVSCIKLLDRLAKDFARESIIIDGLLKSKIQNINMLHYNDKIFSLKMINKNRNNEASVASTNFNLFLAFFFCFIIMELLIRFMFYLE